MLQIKKILLTCLSMMLFQVDLSATSLLVSSQCLNADGVPLNVHCLSPLVDDVAYGRSDPKVAEAFGGNAINALIIDSTYQAGRFVFRLETGVVEFLTDDQLVDALRERGLNSDIVSDKRTIEFVFLNASNTKDLCRRLQNECGIPVVMGWAGIVSPKDGLLVSFIFLQLLSVGIFYKNAFHDAAITVMNLNKLFGEGFSVIEELDEELTTHSSSCAGLNVFLSCHMKGWYTSAQFNRAGGYTAPFVPVEPS